MLLRLLRQHLYIRYCPAKMIVGTHYLADIEPLRINLAFTQNFHKQQ